MTPEREERIKKMVRCRQPNLTVVLENVQDPHNIFAILRTCDAIGVQNVYVIDPIGVFDTENMGKRSSASSRKWVTTKIYDNAEACYKTLREKYDLIFGTAADKKSASLYELDLTRSVALVFGNEREGIAKSSEQYFDGQFQIPQVGMIRSLNVSVACAVSLYEAFRQRNQKGFYDQPQLSELEQQQLFQELTNR